MELLITKRPEEIYTVLYKALEKLISNRLSDNAFTDQEDVRVRAYFSTLEGLEALLIPFVYLPKNLVWDPLKNLYKELSEILFNDVNFVLSFNSKDEVPPKEHGLPYFEQGKGVRKTPYWTSECASFTLSVLTNFLMLRHNVGLSGGPSEEKVVKVIKTNLQWVKLCKRDNGWSWTTDSPSHPWPTWSLLDTFEEMVNCDLITEIHDSISGEYEPILKKIVESFATDVVGTYLNDWQEKVVNSNPYDIEAVLDLTRLMLAICLLHSDRKTVKPLAYNLFLWASETDFSNLDYSHHLKIKSDYIPDSSLIPCVFRTLLTMAGALRFRLKGVDDLDKRLGKNHEVVLHRVYSYLQKSQISHGKYKGLWGVSNGSVKYELYYTERVIESLTEFLLHYEYKDFTAAPSVDRSEKTKRTAIEGSAKGNSKGTEKLGNEESLGVMTAKLPILEEFANKEKKKNQNAFDNLIIIYVLHFLNDLPPFAKNFHDLGCSYDDMYFLVKTYAYPQLTQIQEYFVDKGCKVFVPTDSRQETFDALVGKILDECITKSGKKGKRILVVEDGGYFAPKFHAEKYRADINKCIGVVEQTTKGYRRDMQIKNPQFPIVTVATSQLKQYLESPEVAETLQENIIQVMKDEKPPNLIKALILGFGNIGEQLAVSLDNKRVSVSIFDIDVAKRMKAEQSRSAFRSNVLSNLDDLSAYDIIVGTSGETSINEGELYWTLKQNAILASGSSERIEFDLLSLENQSEDIQRHGIFTVYVLKKNKKLVRLLCDGEPINFALSGGISNKVIDPVYAEMFLGAIALVSKKFKNKINQLPANIEAEVYRLYKKYHTS